MNIVALTPTLIGPVRDLMAAGEPYIRVRTDSDYWLYATLFSTTCPVALDGDVVVGAAIAFRSQDHPTDVYIQDVMIHPGHRKAGVARQLLAAIVRRAEGWGCRRLYLTSEPDNTAAHTAWTRIGFINVPGHWQEQGQWVTKDFKGPGRHRAVYQLAVASQR